MLYAEDTGMPEQIVVEATLSEDDRQAIELGQKVMTMTSTAGWQWLHAQMIEQIAAVKEKLVDENDPTVIPRLQQQARTLSDVIVLIAHTVEYGQSLATALPLQNQALDFRG